MSRQLVITLNNLVSWELKLLNPPQPFTLTPFPLSSLSSNVFDVIVDRSLMMVDLWNPINMLAPCVVAQLQTSCDWGPPPPTVTKHHNCSTWKFIDVANYIVRAICQWLSYYKFMSIPFWNPSFFRINLLLRRCYHSYSRPKHETEQDINIIATRGGAKKWLANGLLNGMFIIFSIGKSAIGTNTIHSFMLFIFLFIVFGVVYKQVTDLNYLDKIYDLFNTHQENIQTVV